MVLIDRGVTREHNAANTEAELQIIVMGLHWTPTDEKSEHAAADLDALCALFDAQGHVLEVIHPGHTRSGNGAVIHTGDSRTGASSWDDERIFVFLKALPSQVVELAFMVASSAQQPFEEVRGASCHISDHENDTELLRVDVTAFGAEFNRTIAIVRRSGSGWCLSASEPGQGPSQRTAP